MCEIYLRDDLVTQQPGPRKTTPEIWNILQEIRSESPTDIKQVALGFILKFQRDQDVNFIMQDNSYNLLRQKNLTPKLSNYTRFYREILISDIPDSIYEEEEYQIKQDLEQQNHISILHLIKYTSTHSSRKFLKAIFYTKIAKENILHKGIIYLHSVRLHVSNSCLPPPVRSSNRPNIRPAATPTSHQRGPLLPSGSAWANNYGNQQGPLLPSGSAWTNNNGNRPHRQQHTPNPINSVTQNNQATHNPDQLNFQENFNMHYRLKAIDIMCSRLSKDDPNTYIGLFNKFLILNGYPVVKVPMDAYIKNPSNSTSNGTDTHQTLSSQTPQPFAQNPPPAPGSTPASSAPQLPPQIPSPAPGSNPNSSTPQHPLQSPSTIPASNPATPTTQAPVHPLSPAPDSTSNTPITQSADQSTPSPATFSTPATQSTDLTSSLVTVFNPVTSASQHAPQPIDNSHITQMHVTPFSDNAAAIINFTNSRINSIQITPTLASSLVYNCISHALSSSKTSSRSKHAPPTCLTSLMQASNNYQNSLNISNYSQLEFINGLFSMATTSRDKKVTYKIPKTYKRNSEKYLKNSASTTRNLRSSNQAKRHLNYCKDEL